MTSVATLADFWAQLPTLELDDSDFASWNLDPLEEELLSPAELERLRSLREDHERNFELHEKQYDFVFDDEHKYCAFFGGIGSGKSFGGGIKSLRKMVGLPGSLGVIGAPNFRQLRDSTLRTVIEVVPPALIESFNKTYGILKLKNGSEALLRSCDDPDNLRGPNLAWFWLDEGPLCGHYAWRLMKGRLRQTGFTNPDQTQGWITGTPKGQDEFYEDFENFDGSHAPRDGSHTLYRASTRENAHNLPPTFIEDLGYDGQFAQQEIDGEFVTYEGLVYEFRTEWHVGEWPEGRRPTLKIGGIDWGFTNPAVALPIWVDAADHVFVRDEFYKRQAGLAGLKPAVLEFSRLYGIATWYCGPDEPEHILELNALFGNEGVKSRAVAANDEINPGIETVRRCMRLVDGERGGLQISARCVQTRGEFRTYAYPSSKDAARDPLEKPVKKFDHAMDACFVAGTLVETANGPQTIETIAPGAQVWTRDGLREVVAAGMTNPAADVLTVEFDDGSTLQGTANHPIWVQGTGWRSLHVLTQGDTLCTWKQAPFTSMASSSAATPTQSGGLTARITRPAGRIASRALAVFTRKSGRRLTGLFRKGATFITETATRSITQLTTWNASQRPTTFTSMDRGPLPTRNAHTWIGFGRKLLNGIGRTKAVLGIVCMLKSKNMPFAWSGFAHGVARPSTIEAQAVSVGSVPMPVRRHGDVDRAWTWKSTSASCAGRDSRLTSIGRERPVAIRVARVSSGGIVAPVYNLTVAETPEYFANGILVHNCRYALHSTLGLKTRHRDVPQDTMVTHAERASDIGGIRILKKVF